MNLTTFENLLQDYIEGSLDEATRVKMDTCLCRSPECRELLESYRRIDSVLEEGLAAVALSSAFSSEVMKRFEIESACDAMTKTRLKSALAEEFQREIRRLRRSVALPGLRDLFDFIGVAATGVLLVWGVGPYLQRVVEPMFGDRFGLPITASGTSIMIAAMSLVVFAFLACRRVASIPRW